MRLLQPVLLVTITGCLFGQTAQIETFKKTIFDGSSMGRQQIDTIDTKGKKLDVYFLNEHFGYPYQLPSKFSDSHYKSQTITVWKDSTKKGNYERNTSKTYTYDAFGRLIHYSYSGCMVCSNLPYECDVTYNTKGQIATIANSGDKIVYKFYYDFKGGIVKYERFSFGKIDRVIALLD